MISLVRIDDRLIHGQVAVVWSKHLGVDRILVANDQIVKNDVQKMSLKMATPDSIKCAIQSVDDAAKLLNDPRSEELKILVIINNANDAKRLAQQVNKMKHLNVANYGRITDDLSSKKRINDTVYLSDEDFIDFKYISSLGVNIEYQVLPSHTAKDFIDLINKA